LEQLPRQIGAGITEIGCQLHLRDMLISIWRIHLSRDYLFNKTIWENEIIFDIEDKWLNNVLFSFVIWISDPGRPIQ
jgi:hypothetical protein